MKTFNYICNSLKLDEFIDFSTLMDEKNILIQVFCGNAKDELEQIVKTLKANLPQAAIIGSTTDGEIADYSILSQHTVISISVFKATKITTEFIEDLDSFECGKKLAKKLISKKTKLLILFSDGTHMNAEEFLNGVSSVDKNIIVCGGMAGDNGNFKKTYISSNDKILSRGAVGVALDSDVLKVATDYKFDWKAIGLEHTINKVKGNRVYEIDGMNPSDFYIKYLGNNISQIEFPLIKQNKDFPIARAVISRHEDGSLSFSGNFKEGEKVKIGYGDAKSLLKNPLKVLKNLNKFEPETFFIYSCMARRRYMPDLTKIQVKPFASIAPTSGFFTYSEFYHHNCKNEVLNQTLTAVALSEADKSIKAPSSSSDNKNSINKKEASYAKTIQSLTNLIQQSNEDYAKQSKKLEEQIAYSNNILKSHKQFLRHTIHEMNLPLSVIMNNIELHELEFGKSTYLENIEVGVKSIFSLFDDLSYLVRKDQITYFKRKIDLVDYIRARIDFFSQVALKVNSKFVFTHPKDDITIFFNETKLQRIIDNNLTNAIKYTYENKDIHVKLEKEDNRVIFSISSCSRQIQEPKKVFEEYYREEESKDGFGLGLNLVKRICVEENIDINLTSKKELTTFTYIFKEGVE
ncbi:FIST N-terminal domain-containing protein [Sulfurospirillum sp. 1307]|jgi:anti-sigma regulatory factor (Ser/Thr protein kinase)